MTLERTTSKPSRVDIFMICWQIVSLAIATAGAAAIVLEVHASAPAQPIALVLVAAGSLLFLIATGFAATYAQQMRSSK